MSLVRPSYQKVPDAMAGHLRITSAEHSARSKQLNRYGFQLFQTSGSVVLCWVATGAAKHKRTPELTGRALSSVFAFEPNAHEVRFSSGVTFTECMDDCVVVGDLVRELGCKSSDFLKRH